MFRPFFWVIFRRIWPLIYHCWIKTQQDAYHKSCIENTASKLFLRCILGICFLAIAVYRVITLQWVYVLHYILLKDHIWLNSFYENGLLWPIFITIAFTFACYLSVSAHMQNNLWLQFLEQYLFMLVTFNINRFLESLTISLWTSEHLLFPWLLQIYTHSHHDPECFPCVEKND
jgi:hypothetical protein